MPFERTSTPAPPSQERPATWTSEQACAAMGFEGPTIPVAGVEGPTIPVAGVEGPTIPVAGVDGRPALRLGSMGQPTLPSRPRPRPVLTRCRRSTDAIQWQRRALPLPFLRTK